MVTIPVWIRSLSLNYDSISWEEKTTRKRVIGWIDRWSVVLLSFLENPCVKLFWMFLWFKCPKRRRDLGISKILVLIQIVQRRSLYIGWLDLLNRGSVILDRLNTTALRGKIWSRSFDQCRWNLLSYEWATRSGYSSSAAQTHLSLNLHQLSVGFISLFHFCRNVFKRLHRLNEFLNATSAEFGWAILASSIITLRDLEISTSMTGCGVWWHRAINALIPVDSVQKIQVHIISIYTHIALSCE